MSPPPSGDAVRARLLVVDDEPDLRTLYELTLLREGFDVDSAGSVDEAWSQLSERAYDAVITDMRLPDGTGLEIIRRLDAAQRAEKTLVITAYASPENAVEALKAGAYDYMTKPVDLRQFRRAVVSAIGRAADALSSSSSAPPSAPPSPHAVGRLVGEAAAMHQLRAVVAKVARGMAPVLVNGESGTGKELVARAIHDASPRARAAFVAVNCSAIPEPLLEAEFFGHRKGAFTGAVQAAPGLFQAAAGGTLFLDEVGELPLSMQSKLLRAIQERSIRPIGETAEVAVDVRIVSATHRDLAADVAAGRFRQDLYYRLNVIRLEVPALRERLGDLPLLGRALLARIAADAGVDAPPRLSDGALARLARHPFPGNVRELENLLHRAVALSGCDVLEADDLGLPDDAAGGADGACVPPPESARGRDDAPAAPAAPSLDPVAAIAAAAASDVGAAAGALPKDLAAHLDDVEREILLRALHRHRFNRTAAGAAMGLSLRQMRYRMARLGIQAPETGGE